MIMALDFITSQGSRVNFDSLPNSPVHRCTTNLPSNNNNFKIKKIGLKHPPKMRKIKRERTGRGQGEDRERTGANT